jgi:hypothetical protein
MKWADGCHHPRTIDADRGRCRATLYPAGLSEKPPSEAHENAYSSEPAMRLALSVVGLLVVGYLVLNMAKRQAQVLVPRSAAAAASAASAAGASAPHALPQQVQQDVQKLLEQGARRASEVAP